MYLTKLFFVRNYLFDISDFVIQKTYLGLVCLLVLLETSYHHFDVGSIHTDQDYYPSNIILLKASI